MCFKHFKEGKYFYSRNSVNENEVNFFLIDRYFFFYEKKIDRCKKNLKDTCQN